MKTMVWVSFLLPTQEDETRDHVEISPQSLVLVQKMASRIHRYGGRVLQHPKFRPKTFRRSIFFAS